MRGLAVTSRTRAATLPELPTMIEAGIADFDVVLWAGLFAPAGTPRAVVERIHQGVVNALEGFRADLDDSAKLQLANAVKSADELLQGLARFSPAFGMIGTIMGLVDLFKNMRDSASLGPQ